MILTSILHGIKKAAIALGLCTAAFIAYLLLAPMVVWLAGYYPDAPGLETAQQIIVRQRPVSDCFKLVHTLPHLLAPTLGEQQALCVYKYAELTKDPAACELLLPSSYGKSCLGAASDSEPCVFLGDGQGTVKGQGIVTTYDACLSGPQSTQQHACCVMARITLEKNYQSDCSIFSHSDALSDQCHHEVALKMKDLDQCALMKNERNRRACEIEVGPMKEKEPELP